MLFFLLSFSFMNKFFLYKKNIMWSCFVVHLQSGLPLDVYVICHGHTVRSIIRRITCSIIHRITCSIIGRITCSIICGVIRYMRSGMSNCLMLTYPIRTPSRVKNFEMAIVIYVNKITEGTANSHTKTIVLSYSHVQADLGPIVG